jgi:hypothetical protein
MDMQDFKSKVECLPQLHRGLQSRPTGVWSPCRSWKVCLGCHDVSSLEVKVGSPNAISGIQVKHKLHLEARLLYVSQIQVCFRRIWPTHKSLLLDEVYASLVSHWFEIIPKWHRQDHLGQLISSQEINQTFQLPLPLNTTNRNQRVCSFRVSHKIKNRHH